MKRSSTRVATVAVAALLGTGIAVPLTATPAAAVAATETQFFVSDKVADDNLTYGLYRRTTPTGAATLVAGDDGKTDLSSVSASRDGSRFVTLETTLDASGNPARDRVVVYDVSGRRVRTVHDIPASSGFLFSAALSPDGQTVVWSFFNGLTGAISLLKAGAGSGSASVLGSNLAGAVFADNSTLIVEDVAGPWYSMAVTGGTKTAVPGIPATAIDPVTSADGTKIAWSDDTTSTSVDTADIQVGTLSVSSGVASVTSAATVVTGLNNVSPAFSRDGANVLFVKNDGNGGAGAVYTAPSSGSPVAGTAVDGTSVGDVYSQAIGTTDDGTAPGSATAGVATLLGSSATLRWTLPADGDLSGVLISRTGAATVYVPAPLTSTTVSGLTPGSTYTFTITAVDRSGGAAAADAGQADQRTLTAVLVKPFAYSPTSTRFSRAPFTVTFSGSAVPSTVKWSVSYRTNSGPTWTPWVSGVAGTSRTFGAPAATGVAATTSTPGSTYVFKVSATDGHGNSTLSSGVSTPVVVPFDQTKAAFSSSAGYAVSSAWLGSYRLMRATGSYARATLTGNQFSLIGARCASCGVLDIYDGTRLVKSVDTYRSTALQRVVLAQLTYSGVGTHTYTIRVRGTAGRPNVIIDGFGMRR